MLRTTAYYRTRGDNGRTRVPVTDSAHGTNPASATMAGLQVLSFFSDRNSNSDLMQSGGGRRRPGGVHAHRAEYSRSVRPQHSRGNTYRPHRRQHSLRGWGPVKVSSRLARYLPAPIVERQANGDGKKCYRLVTPTQSIGPVGAFHGNFGALVRAYSYIRTLG